MNIDFDDKRYISLLSGGDLHAFDIIFLYYHPMLVKYIYGFIKDEEQARDICQDVFLKLWTQRENISDIRSLKGFLFNTARFAIYNFFDKNLVSRKYINEYLHKQQKPEDVEELYFARELRELIMLAVSKMPEQRRKVYLMSREESLTNQQIADKLKISKRTVENHITAALSSIRKLSFIFILLNSSL